MNNIREAHIEDAQDIIEYIKKVSDETDFLISGSEERQLDVKREEEFLQSIQHLTLEKMFLYEISGKIVGICNLKGINKVRIRHRVDLGITVLKDYWSRGIASELINHAVDYCRLNYIKKIELTVRTDNERALKLYKKAGFDIEGEIKSFFCINGIYYNCYIMGLFV
ncbi:GNAT family N-acetyltransferase [Brachyspira sp. G79]|uniref:GNAT family N-acetyltransferase n=1 Tax=Brachyspira sp. G79 TaxID=1358104 RepID=UPI000BBC7A0C|nr:GNAT family N-acetyltransferase [Brachyspira sp. G79]PCG19197.1 acetyltransferase [Brachyspira sp. G79]